MREYKIFKTDLWWWIYRKQQKDILFMLQYLSGKDTRVTNKTLARTFYNRDSAVAALVICRRKNEWEESD